MSLLIVSSFVSVQISWRCLYQSAAVHVSVQHVAPAGGKQERDKHKAALTLTFDLRVSLLINEPEWIFVKKNYIKRKKGLLLLLKLKVAFAPPIMCLTTRGSRGSPHQRHHEKNNQCKKCWSNTVHSRRFHQSHYNIPQTRLSGQVVTFYPDTLIFQLASSVDILDLIKLISLNAASVKPVKK